MRQIRGRCDLLGLCVIHDGCLLVVRLLDLDTSHSSWGHDASIPIVLALQECSEGELLGLSQTLVQELNRLTVLLERLHRFSQLLLQIRDDPLSFFDSRLLGLSLTPRLSQLLLQLLNLRLELFHLFL